ncbi:Protein of unknown function [Algoriphagus ornithinivorans]|uniref:DUF1573 domain-containing protein n=2 Tax=Algoriphagus ornithinivorans TaxID=226506 RepID=A0A1I5DV50_9BACT|nr:Protein of unknown function [Algoriphagus ornithinivorans]
MNFLGNSLLILFLTLTLLMIPTFESSMLIIKPKIQFVTQEDRNEYGEIEVNFEIENTGKEAIRILSVSPHCSCTDFNLSSSVIYNGKSELLTLTVEWDQIKSLGEVYAVLKTDSKQKYLKVSIRVKD